MAISLQVSSTLTVTLRMARVFRITLESESSPITLKTQSNTISLVTGK